VKYLISCGGAFLSPSFYSKGEMMEDPTSCGTNVILHFLPFAYLMALFFKGEMMENPIPLVELSFYIFLISWHCPFIGEMMEDPTPCGGIFHCPNGTECRGEWEVIYFQCFCYIYKQIKQLLHSSVKQKNWEGNIIKAKLYFEIFNTSMIKCYLIKIILRMTKGFNLKGIDYQLFPIVYTRGG
jgi:hypothetical protein